MSDLFNRPFRPNFFNQIGSTNASGKSRNRSNFAGPRLELELSVAKESFDGANYAYTIYFDSKKIGTVLASLNPRSSSLSISP